eukprot:CAMPEP_0183394112 /NCGR_PEP_ID=MMETSP0370-20130417/8343_1 /TAXON_ID=268820 /ORGANISM="Peridinium aciculiferum, Strain PAER-2" /LENGTH=38 /DNA_ID= /DNA_START= /DNA_END= /DNA_ORIENTATION=
MPGASKARRLRAGTRGHGDFQTPTGSDGAHLQSLLLGI